MGTRGDHICRLPEVGVGRHGHGIVGAWSRRQMPRGGFWRAGFLRARLALSCARRVEGAENRTCLPHEEPGSFLNFEEARGPSGRWTGRCSFRREPTGNGFCSIMKISQLRALSLQHALFSNVCRESDYVIDTNTEAENQLRLGTSVNGMQA